MSNDLSMHGSSLAWSPAEVALLEVAKSLLTSIVRPTEGTFYATDDGTPMVSLHPADGGDAWYTFWKTEAGIYCRNEALTVTLKATLRDHITAIITATDGSRAAPRPWDQHAAVETCSFVVPKVAS
jgi:hypothetical protein